jgi:hypothetical protein
MADTKFTLFFKYQKTLFYISQCVFLGLLPLLKTLPQFHTGAPNPVNKIKRPDHPAPLQRGEVLENIQYWGKRVSGESAQQRLICVDSPVELRHVLVEILV